MAKGEYNPELVHAGFADSSIKRSGAIPLAHLDVNEVVFDYI